MPLPASKIFVLVEPPTAFIRLVGRAAVEGARDFKSLVLRLDREGIRQFCLDLGECKLMDSTFSGVLAALTSELGPHPEHGCRRLTLVNPNERVSDLLDNLGVLSLVTVLTGDGHIHRPDEAVEHRTAIFSKEESAACCLEAHLFLMTLNPENQARFSDLAHVLEGRAGAVK